MELRNKLITLSEGKNSCDENGYIFKSYTIKGRVEYEKIPEITSLDLEKYRKPATLAWKIERVWA